MSWPVSILQRSLTDSELYNLFPAFWMSVAGQCLKTLIYLFVTMLNSRSVRAPKNKHDSMQKKCAWKKDWIVQKCVYIFTRSQFIKQIVICRPAPLPTCTSRCRSPAGHQKLPIARGNPNVDFVLSPEAGKKSAFQSQVAELACSAQVGLGLGLGWGWVGWAGLTGLTPFDCSPHLGPRSDHHCYIRMFLTPLTEFHHSPMLFQGEMWIA